MDLSAIFLGTGGSVPSARRSTASVMLVRGGRRMMFDCGEGTQRQLHRSFGLAQVDEIYLTHFHADHILGLPGLLKTYDLTGREEPLTIYGPRGLRDLFKTLGRLIGRTDYGIDLVELDPGEAVRHDGAEVQAFAVEHSVRANGYVLIEEERPGRFDPEEAERRGVAEGPAFAALQRGEEVEGSDGTVRPQEVMGEARPGRLVALTGDTAPCHSTVSAVADADLLIHDASFSEEEVQRAADTGHSTVGQAAAVAREAHVKMLALVHISSRYHVGKVLEEAQDIFEPSVAPRDFDLIDIPFPERGEPTLVANGARERANGEVESEAAPEPDRESAG
jgi:ribonuclease Z